MPRPALSPEEKDARRRLKRVTPQNAAKVTSKDIYWTVPFLELYLERCDSLAFDAPREGLDLALHAPQLARRVPVDRGAGTYRSFEVRYSFEVRSIVVLASLYRLVGHYLEAERHYEAAFALTRTQTVSQDAQAELIRRHGYFLLSQRDPLAIPALEDAVQAFRGCDDRNGLADALVSLGICRCELQSDIPDGLRHFAEALTVLDAGTVRGQETAMAALANLSHALSLGATLAHQDEVRALVKQARAALSTQPRSLLKAKLLWMEGLLYRNLHFARHAARLLGRARSMFESMGLPELFALVSLDLAAVLIDDDEMEAFEAVRLETDRKLREATSDPKLLEALGRWRSERRPSRTFVDRIKRDLAAHGPKIKSL
ncbi:MAG: hypothetical protein AAGM22_02685 [Acidobacteriota bacterium]